MGDFNMAIAVPGKWLWDSWYARDASLWHGFFLQADRALGDPDLRHFHVTHGNATSSDLKSWTYLGTCFESQRNGPAWDDSTTWTGSVVTRRRWALAPLLYWHAAVRALAVPTCWSRYVH
jgi:hypothetical protein